MFDKETFIFLILVLMTTNGFSQNENFGNQLNSHIFRFTDTHETVGIEDALEYDSDRIGYKWGFTASIDQATNTLIAIDGNNNDRVLSYVDNIKTLNLGTSYLYRHFLLFGVALPVHSVTLTSQGNAITGGGLETATTLGDTNLFLKWRLTGKGSKLNFAIMPRVILPTGDEALLVSDGFGFGLRALISYQARSFKIYSHFGLLSTPDSGFLSVTRAQRLEAAIGTLLKLTKRIGLNAEITGDVAFGGETGVDQNTVSILAGLRYSFSQRLKLFAGLTINGILEAQAQDFGFYAGLKFAFGRNENITKQNETIAARQQTTQDKDITQLEPEIIKQQEKKVATIGKRPGELEYSGFEIKSNGQSGIANVLNSSVLEQNYQVPVTRYQKVQTPSGFKYKEISKTQQITPATQLSKIQTDRGILYTPKAIAQTKTFKKIKTTSGIKYKEIPNPQEIAFQRIKTPEGVTFKEVETVKKPIFQKVSTPQGIVYSQIKTKPEPIIKKIRTSQGIQYKEVIEPQLPVYQKIKTAKGIKYENVATQKVAKFKKVNTSQGVVFTQLEEPKFEAIVNKNTPGSIQYKKVSLPKPVFKKITTAQGTIFKKVSTIPSPVFEEVKTLNGISYKQKSEKTQTYFQEVPQSNGQVDYRPISTQKAQRIVKQEIQQTTDKPIFKQVRTSTGIKYKKIVKIPTVSKRTALKAVQTEAGTIYQPQELVKKPLYKKIKTSKGIQYKKIETPKFATYKKVKTRNGNVFKEVNSIKEPVFKKVQTNQGLVYKKVKQDKDPIIQRVKTPQGIQYKQVQLVKNPKFEQVRTLTGIQYKKVKSSIQTQFKKVNTNEGVVFTEVVKPIYVKKPDSIGKITYQKISVKNPVFKKFETAQGIIYKQVKEVPKSNFKEVQTSRGISYKKVKSKLEPFYQEVKLSNGNVEYKKVSVRKATRDLIAFETISKPATYKNIPLPTNNSRNDTEFINQPVIKKVNTENGVIYKQTPILADTKYEKVKTSSGIKYQQVTPIVRAELKKIKTNQGIVYKEVPRKTFKKITTSNGTKYTQTFLPTPVFKRVSTPQGIIFKKAAQLINPPVIKKIRTNTGIKFTQVENPNEIKYKKVETNKGVQYKKMSIAKPIEYRQVDTPEGRVYTEVIKPRYKKIQTNRGVKYQKITSAKPVFKKFETAQGVIFRQVNEVPKAIFKEVVSLSGQTQYKKVETAPETFFQEVQTLTGETTYKEISPRLAKSILAPIAAQNIATNEPLYKSKSLERKVNQEISRVQRAGLPTPIKTDSEGKVIKFTNRTLFRFNKYDLSNEAKKILEKVARVIKKYERRIGRIQILGHTDTIGTIWYNRYLSQKRAGAVKAYLIEIGINPNILDAYGMGEEQPRVFPERTEADRQTNRRAEFYFKLLFKKTSRL